MVDGGDAVTRAHRVAWSGGLSPGSQGQAERIARTMHVATPAAEILREFRERADGARMVQSRGVTADDVDWFVGASVAVAVATLRRERGLMRRYGL